MIYLIAYSINERLYDYSDLKDYIKSLGRFQHPIDDVWFVSTRNSLNEREEIDYLRQKLHSDKDMVFMTAISDSSLQGWMPNAFWQWFDSLNK